MKKAFSNLFGGKREKEKDKASDAVEERLQTGTSAGEAGTAATLVRTQQTAKEVEVKQHKQKDKHGKQHKQKAGSGKSRDSQPQTKGEKQWRVSGVPEEAASLQLQAQNSCESDRSGTLRAEPLLQSPAPPGDLGEKSKQQQPAAPSQSPESAAECQHLQQKIATLQGHILELESALESAGVPPSPSPPGSESGGVQRVSGGDSKVRPADRLPSMTQSCQTEPAVGEGGEKCPTCGRVPEVAERGDSAETGVQTDAGGERLQCAACGGAMAVGRVSDEGADVQESGASAAVMAIGDKAEPGSRLGVGKETDPVIPPGSPETSPEPGDLSSEVARLASVQQHLQQSPPPPTKHPSPTSRTSAVSPPVLTSAEVQTECSHDQLTRELQELTDKYDQLKKSCDALEEQKNELEEAENDARLMVQRQEVQIFTAGEVERMLSSELAEEQERCSQLQRQLNSVRLKHQAALRARQADSESSGSQNAQLVHRLQAEVEELRRQLEQREHASGEKRPENVSVVVVDAGARLPAEGESPSTVSPEPSAGEDRVREDCVSPLTAASHTEKSSTFSDSGVGEDMSHASDVTAISPAPPSPHALSDTGRTRVPSDARPESRLSSNDEPVRCSQCSREMSREVLRELGGLSTTASAGNSLLTIAGADQERYLAAALQLLEAQQGGAPGEGNAASRRDSHADDDSHHDESLTRQVALLQTELGAQLGSFEETRQTLVRQHERQLQTLRSEQSELQRQLAAARQLQDELNAEFELSSTGTDETVAESGPALLRAVRETRHREQQLAAHCADLEKKEGAYRETLEEADRIMHSVEMRYQKNIEELENQLRESKNRINFMEGTEEKLKQALYTGSGKRDQQRVAELLDKLIETENEDLKLKDKVYRLERREREQSIKLREEQRAAEQLRIELRDQEELLRELDSARSQLAAAAEQPAALAALQQRVTELQRSEQRLRARVEELEQAEQALNEQLSDGREQFALKERRLGEQVDCRQRELESLQAVLVEMQLQEVAGTEERAQLRRELQQALRQHEQLQQELQHGGAAPADGAGNFGPADEQRSAEVGKLRTQLSQANLQINENEAMSCQLREQLEKLQSNHTELRQTAECQRTRAEQDILQLNLELSRREEEIAALSAQLRELNKTQMTREMDALAEQEGNLVKLLALVKATDEKIKSCDSCRRSADGVLAAVMISLEQVILLISGASADQSLQAQLRDAEALAAATARLSAPPPGVSTGVQTAPLSPSAAAAAQLPQLQETLELNQQQLELSKQELELKTEELEARGCELRLLREQLAQQQRQLRRRLAQQAAQGGAVAEAKDRLLGALLRRLRRVLTPQQAARLAAELREAGDGEADRQSFDLDVVCQVLQQTTRTEQTRGKTPPVEKSSERSLESLENSSNSKASSRIPRLFNKPNETSPSETPASRKRSPPSKVPLPRRATPGRSSGPPVLPPVGVARPYRSASSPGLGPVAPPTPSQREWSPAPSLTRECSPAPVRESSPATSSAREWSPAPRPHRPPSPDGLLPPPDGFQIVRAVGGDSLLLYWSPVEDPRITGYQIFVDSQLQLSIRNPQRTKALLPALDLSSTLRLGIRAVAAGETYSALACADHRPGKLAAAA
ncbi:plectin-like [Amphibalanus amphitrite]|uniref:plectin-like n=1 Tax=Amphibalanus amphitrite TaxID=1232801 RepID=UPI001C91A8A9|nr:plectin-like [Amphibalanus amphitrite]